MIQPTFLSLCGSFINVTRAGTLGNISLRPCPLNVGDRELPRKASSLSACFHHPNTVPRGRSSWRAASSTPT
ncbi:hypothetical protein PF011_g4151 [Phytophthora fragariae]|uniref:Uncharacterized protein n=1 Tax=Phytophthora fragariae TaxID=53985 RepID=A0A6A3LTX7_9STRA|nr:hypothetical protein PF011_g4151 [Phytophthora fragariae]